MAFWCRINQSKLKHLARLVTRDHHLQVPTSHCSVTATTIYVEQKPFWGIVKKPSDFCNNVRFYAAPFQAQSKKEDKDSNGPRLNDQIRAQFVRLVTEDGHKVVSRHEALERARRLELDLVEVQRHADPPVCKIMDFHKEKYKKELQDKDRSKAKSDVTLKKGGYKEVRFSGKIEQKDLQMKADMVKRLMERGYRVKCMALPVGRKEEGEDLGAYLSRLIALVEDTSVIESGPHVERKQAYVLIRHVKFGPSKKGGGKKSKDIGDTAIIHEAGTSPAITVSLDEEDPAEFGSETEDDFNRVFGLSDNTKGSTSANLNASNFSHPKPVPSFPRADTLPSTPPEPSFGTENRYKRSEPRNQFPQTRSMDQFPQTRSMDNRSQRTRDYIRTEPQFPNQRTQPPANMQVSPSMGEKKRVGTEASVFRNTKPPNSIPEQEPSYSDGCSNTTPGYGIFSNTKANAPGNPGTEEIGANQNIPGLKSRVGGQRPGVDGNGQSKFGIFSR